MHVKLLLFAISKTQQFEQLLGKRFTGVTVQQDASGSVAKEESGPAAVATITTPFTDLIGRCFKPFLDIYTDSIDKNLSELMDQFQQFKFNPQLAKQSSILTSGADLFVFYKKCLVQCNQLAAATGKPMYDLGMIFKKYLREYASKCLENKIPKLTAASATTNLASNISTNILNRENLQQLSTAAGQVRNIRLN